MGLHDLSVYEGEKLSKEEIEKLREDNHKRDVEQDKQLSSVTVDEATLLASNATRGSGK
jgi:hypothetical protein